MSTHFLQPCTSRPQRLTPQQACRAEHGAATQSQQQPQRREQPSRRGALLLLPAAAAAAVAWPRSALAEQPAAETPAAGAVTEELTFGSVPAAAAVDLDVARWPMWVDRNFSFSYPKGLYEVQDLTYAAPQRRTGSDQVTENPLKAEVRSEDGQQRINVVVSQAAALKRTLFQVTDISQLGDAKAVARLLLPPGAAVLSYSTEAVPQPPKDTGTVLGVIERDPVNYFSYEVLLRDGTHLQMTAAALLGRIYVLGASAPDARWQECGPSLQEVARSFRLRYRV